MVVNEIITAAMIATLYNPTPTLERSVTTLEERMPHLVQSCINLQTCAKYKFDGRWARDQFGKKCVTYFKSNREEVITIYEEGILTTIYNGKYIERNRVEVESKGIYPWEDLFKVLGDIPVSTQEYAELRILYMLLKDLLLKPE